MSENIDTKEEDKEQSYEEVVTMKRSANRKNGSFPCNKGDFFHV